MENSHQLDISADEALFAGKVDVLVAACAQNERPLAGLSGQLDWHVRGEITRGIRRGMISGEPGECVYLPISRYGKTFHLLLVGAGISKAPGQRDTLPAESLRALTKNLHSLKLKNVGLSNGDLGEISAETLKKQLKGISLWIAA